MMPVAVVPIKLISMACFATGSSLASFDAKLDIIYVYGINKFVVYIGRNMKE